MLLAVSVASIFGLFSNYLLALVQSFPNKLGFPVRLCEGKASLFDLQSSYL
jgi:hypothetical protein